MPTLFRPFLALGIILVLPSLTPAQTPAPPAAPAPPAIPPPPSWAITTAPARFVIAPDDVNHQATLSWVHLGLPNLDWLRTPIRVFTDAGVPVASSVLWAAPGEPITLLFDSSSAAKQYDVYLGSTWPAMPLNDPKAGVMLESRAGDGRTIDHLSDMLKAWNDSSATINGRAIISSIFEGGHRFGPQGNILEHFQGWFQMEKPGHLQLAAISTDASFILIDGKEVVEWPGRHDFRPGMGGQYQGGVDLPAGPHLLEYYNAYVSSNEGHPLLCCLAVNGGPFNNWTMLQPQSNFFIPSSHAHTVSYDLEVGVPGGLPGMGAPPFAIDWGVDSQSVIDPQITNIGLIALHFTCRPAPPGATITWTFDDGTTATGQNVKHLFPRPGMRVVQVSVQADGKNLGGLQQTISVHPNWMQLNNQHPDLNPDQLADILARDPATFNASDIAGCVAVIGTFKNNDALLKILPAVCAKMKDIDEADLPYVKDAALNLAQQDLYHYADAIKLLTALVDRCTADKPSVQILTIGSEARIALAQLTLKTSDHTDLARKLLDGVSVPNLTGDEHRLDDLLHADLALATGDVDGAKKQYAALTGDPSGPDARSSIRQTAKIGQARAFIDRKDFDSADRALGDVAWQTPIEKLAPDWALTRLRLYQEQNLPVVAYLWAKRLLPVLTDTGRSELLYRMTDLAFAQGDKTLAQKSLAELLKKHPYSEEAAQAKQKWPQ